MSEQIATARVYEGLITSNYGATFGDETTLFYDAVAANTPDFVRVVHQKPASRWAVGPSDPPDQRIRWKAAAVGSPCTITVFGGKVELHDVRESMDFDPCEGG